MYLKKLHIHVFGECFGIISKEVHFITLIIFKNIKPRPSVPDDPVKGFSKIWT